MGLNSCSSVGFVALCLAPVFLYMGVMAGIAAYPCCKGFFPSLNMQGLYRNLSVFLVIYFNSLLFHHLVN
jgi:hypothetical protein